jgi:hypothetical protein
MAKDLKKQQAALRGKVAAVNWTRGNRTLAPNQAAHYKGPELRDRKLPKKKHEAKNRDKAWKRTLRARSKAGKQGSGKRDDRGKVSGATFQFSIRPSRRESNHVKANQVARSTRNRDKGFTAVTRGSQFSGKKGEERRREKMRDGGRDGTKEETESPKREKRRRREAEQRGNNWEVGGA